MSADVPTLLLVIILSSVVMAGALLLLGWRNRQDGLQHWSASLLLAALGYVLFLLRGRIPDGFSVLLGNMLLSASFSLLLAAVRCFHALPLRWPALLAPIALMALVVAVSSDNFPLRVSLAAAVMLLQMLWLLWTLVRHRTESGGRGAQLLMAGVALEVLLLIVRAASGVLVLQENSGFLHGNALQTCSFMVAFIGLLVTSMGFVFMGKDRADAVNRRLAVQDGLTGLANRRSILAALDRDVARAVRTREPLALMMLDIDHFKRVNDVYGHLAGDCVLRHVADTVGRRIRAQDVLGRYGGEEFLLVLPDTTLQGAQQLARQLCEAVQAAPCAWAGQQIHTTLSIGVFGGRLEPQDGWDLLVHAADSALYRAKAAGRNRVESTSQVERARTPRGPGFSITL